MTDTLQDLTLKLITIGVSEGAAQVNLLAASLARANAAAKGTAVSTAKTVPIYNQFGRVVKTLDTGTKKLSKSLGSTAQAQKKLATTTQAATGGFLGLGQTLDQTIKKVAMWTLSTGAVYGTFRAFKRGIGIITEHDQAMINLRKVYSGAESDLEGLKIGIMGTARAMQSLHDAAFDAAVTVARTGRTGLDLIKLTETALVAQNIAELESAESVEYLNAALIQFNQEADQAIRVLDEWNELSNRTPAITRDLAQSISSAGSVFEQAGASIQFLNATTAALVEITAKSGNIVGRALRTIAIYSQRIQTVTKLADIQVDVYDKLTDTYRGIDTILFEIAQKWDELSDSQRANIAQTMAGARQQQFFLALMANQELVLENLYIQWESFGSALREQEKFLLSITKKVDGLIGALERLAIGAGDAGVTATIKGLIDSLTALVNVLGDANAGMYSIAAALGILTTILLPITGTFRLLAAGVAVFTATLFGLTNITDTLSKKQRLMNEEMEQTRLAIEKMTGKSRALQDMLRTVNALLAAGAEDQLYRTLEEISRTTEALFGESVISNIDDYKKALQELTRVAVETEYALRMRKARALETERRGLLRSEEGKAEAPVEYAHRLNEMRDEIESLRTSALQLRITGKFPEPDYRPLEQDAWRLEEEHGAKILRNRAIILESIQEEISLFKERWELELESGAKILRNRAIILESIQEELDLTEKIREEEERQIKASERQMEMFAQRLGVLMTSAMGDVMISAFEGEGVNRALSNFTQRLGDMIGATVSRKITESMITPETDVAGMIAAGLIGGSAGGLISAGTSLISKLLFPYEATEQTRTTDALEANTIQLSLLNDNIRDLTTFFVGAPAGFAIPAGAPGYAGGAGASIMAGGGPTQSMQSIDQSLTISRGAIQISQQPGQSGSDVAAQVTAQIASQFGHGASVDAQY